MITLLYNDIINTTPKIDIIITATFVYFFVIFFIKSARMPPLLLRILLLLLPPPEVLLTLGRFEGGAGSNVGLTGVDNLCSWR